MYQLWSLSGADVFVFFSTRFNSAFVNGIFNNLFVSSSCCSSSSFYFTVLSVSLLTSLLIYSEVWRLINISGTSSALAAFTSPFLGQGPSQVSFLLCVSLLTELQNLPHPSFLKKYFMTVPTLACDLIAVISF